MYKYFSLFLLLLPITAVAQERGILASIFNDSCTQYLSNSREYEYETFCSGYFEALIEQKQNESDLDIFNCYATYKEYDDFKKKAISQFSRQVLESKDKYIRAYGVANKTIETILKEECL